jgi:hypothetical protein
MSLVGAGALFTVAVVIKFINIAKVALKTSEDASASRHLLEPEANGNQELVPVLNPTNLTAEQAAEVYDTIF